MKEVSSSVVRQHWREMLDSMLEGGPDIEILRYKKPIAVMIPARDYEIFKEVLNGARKSMAISDKLTSLTTK